MRAVFLDDAEGQDADALGLRDGVDEVRAGEFFPLGGELLGRSGDGSGNEQGGEEAEAHDGDDLGGVSAILVHS